MFYKLGLLRHLSVAFQRIFELSNSPHASTTCGAPTKFNMYNRKTSAANSLAGSTIDGSMHSGNADSSVNGASVQGNNNSMHGGVYGGGGNTSVSGPGSGIMKAPLSLSSTLSLGPASGSKRSHRRLISDASDFSFTGKAQIATLLASECTLECRYLHCIANLFLKVSLSDAAVVVGMARESECMHSVMAVLQSPALRDYVSKVGYATRACSMATAVNNGNNATASANANASGSVHEKNKERDRPSLLNTNNHNHSSNHSYNSSTRDSTQQQHQQV